MLVSADDNPAYGGPQAQDVRPQLVPGVVNRPTLNLVSKRHEEGSKRHRQPSQYDQQQRDHAFLHQSPRLRHLIGLAEAFHPGNHDARSGPEGEDGGGEQQLQLDRLARRKILQHGTAGAFGQNAAERTIDFAEESLRRVRGGQNRSQHQHGREEGENRRESSRLGNGEGVVLERPPEGQPKMLKER